MSARLYVNAIGFAAPGIESAAGLADHFNGAGLSGDQAWRPAPASLSRRQALRLSESTRLAILAAEQISDTVPGDAAWVFASSVGEGGTLNEILTSLSQSEIMIQPLRFQNSVHNAAQGQWSIVAKAAGPATSIAAYDHTVGAGLLKAMMQAVLENMAVGLVIFDAPLPPPLDEKRHFELPMAASLALSPKPEPGTLCALDIEMISQAQPAPSDDTELAPALMQSGNPVRFILPLLNRIFHLDARAWVLSLPGGGGLQVSVRELSDAT